MIKLLPLVPLNEVRMIDLLMVIGWVSCIARPAVITSKAAVLSILVNPTDPQ
jgi:hypothetical protein